MRTERGVYYAIYAERHCDLSNRNGHHQWLFYAPARRFAASNDVTLGPKGIDNSNEFHRLPGDFVNSPTRA